MGAFLILLFDLVHIVTADLARCRIRLRIDDLHKVFIRRNQRFFQIIDQGSHALITSVRAFLGTL